MLLAAAALLTATGFGPIYSDRPPLGHTGGFGEPTCDRCHAGAPLNDPEGSLTIPPEYRPGSTYRLEMRLARAGMERAGFELSVRHASGALRGSTAGSLVPLDDRVAVAESSGVSYAFHRAARAGPPQRDRVAWLIEWTAPGESTGPVVLHVAANAANDDASELGDYVYADSAVSRPTGEHKR